MQRSKIEQLPPEIKAEFDRMLVDRNFSHYDEIVVWLNNRLQEAGLEISVSRSGAARYGQEFEQRLAAIKIATEQARAITGAVGDEEGAMNEALIRLVQQKAFDVLLNLSGAEDESLIPKMGVMVSRITRASVAQKKWQAEVRERAAAVAKDVEKIAKKGGLSDEAAEQIKEKILGIPKNA